jgi:glutathione S-transferase
MRPDSTAGLARSLRVPSPLVLWGSTGTTSTIAHMVLVEAGADFELRLIGLKDGDNRRPEFLAINPKGEVPALVADGAVITETPAICQYIAETHPHAGLLPDRYPERAQCLSWLAWASYRQAASWIPAMLPVRATREPAAHDAVRACSRRRVAKAIAFLDTALADGRDYLMGSSATLPDFYVAMQLRWARRIEVPLSDGVSALLDRMLKRPAVARVLAAEGLA